jgi:hypothetical protein
MELHDKIEFSNCELKLVDFVMFVSSLVDLREWINQSETKK